MASPELPRDRIAEAPSREDLTVELPVVSGKQANFGQVATELRRRLLGLFPLDANGRRPAHGPNPRFQTIQPGEIRSSSMSTSMPRREKVWRVASDRMDCPCRLARGVPNALAPAKVAKLRRHKLAQIFGFLLSPIALAQFTLERF